MHDLRNAVVELQRARDVALGADRQQFFDIAGLGAKECQHHVASVVADIDEIRRARIARRRRAVTVDRDFERHDGTGRSVTNLRLRAAVDDAGRQMQQEIDQPRRLVAVEQIAQQLVLLRPDAGKARDRCKQRIEQSRAHRIIRHARLHLVKTGKDATVDNSSIIVCRLLSSSPARMQQLIIPRDGGLTSATSVAISTAPGNVRAFGVGLGLNNDGYDEIERRTG